MPIPTPTSNHQIKSNQDRLLQYFLQEELWLVKAWEATPAREEGVTNSSQEVSSSVTSCRRGELLLSWEVFNSGRQALKEARQQLGRMTNVKAQVLGVLIDGLS